MVTEINLEVKWIEPSHSLDVVFEGKRSQK